MRYEKLRVENLVHLNRDNAIVVKMHFCLYQGEILGLVGLNGSGRSTLANMLVGLTSSTAGKIFVDDVPVKINSIAQARRLGIFCIRHKTTLIPHLTLTENMCLLRSGMKNTMAFPASQLQKAAQTAFEELQIPIAPNAPIKELTLAQCHQVEISRAVFCGAKILILDDILRTYTEREKAQLSLLLYRLQKLGMAMVVIDSRSQPLCQVCDRIIAMKNGQNVGVFYKEDFNEATINKLLIGSVLRGQPLPHPSAIGEPLLCAERICTDALEMLDFTVHRGETLGFVQEENSASDIIALFKGAVTLKSGRILLEGRPMPTGGGMAHMVRQGVGFMEYYKNSVFPQLSLRENLTISGLDYLTKATTISSHLEKFAAEEYAKTLGILPEELNLPICKADNLTQMKVALYKLLLAHHKIIVMNNVFSGTDMLLQNCICCFMREAKKKGIAILYTASDVKNVYEICDAVVPITNGRICAREQGEHMF